MSRTWPAVRRGLLVGLALLAVLVTACAGAEGSEPPADPIPTPSVTETDVPTSTPSSDADEPIAFDWTTRPRVELEDGWAIVGCEGDAPFACVERDGEIVGVIELLRYPVGEQDPATLEARVEDYYDVFTEDRAVGCGGDYVVTADPIVAAELDGEAAVLYGFTGTYGDGTPSERHLHAMAQHGDEIVIIAAAAHDPEGCVATEGVAFTSADLHAFAPWFRRLVAGSRL